MDFIQEKIDIVRRAPREMNAIKNNIGDYPTKVGVIIDFINHMFKDDVIKENIDRSKRVY